MIWLYLYRMVLFLVSGVSHYAALYALLWFGQIYGRNEGFLTGDYVYNHVDLAVMAAGIQGIVFLMMISPLGGLFQSASMPVRRMKRRSHPPSELRLEKLFEHPGYETLVKERRTNPIMEQAIKHEKPKKKRSFSKGLYQPYHEEGDLTPYI